MDFVAECVVVEYPGCWNLLSCFGSWKYRLLNWFSRLSSSVLSSVIACCVFFLFLECVRRDWARMCRERFSGKTSFSWCLSRASIEGSGRMSAAHPYPKVVDRVSVPPVGLWSLKFRGRYRLACVGSSDKSCGVDVRSGSYRVWRAIGSNNISSIIGLYSGWKSVELLFKTLL